MSSSLNVYLLDPAATRALVCSRDDQLLEVIRHNFEDELARNDDYFSHQIEQGVPTAYEALRAVVHGGRGISCPGQRVARLQSLYFGSSRNRKMITNQSV
ncbi:DUF7691 family protein [Nocardia asiatica]|uniref:DUF7691 family protein n=1 Tax=Nocardia asiatica TaxID=209252 RepID=UPI0002F6C55D|nr:hypothetical protein [Nocardia asiatica]